jgi:hypothetical protein
MLVKTISIDTRAGRLHPSKLCRALKERAGAVAAVDAVHFGRDLQRLLARETDEHPHVRRDLAQPRQIVLRHRSRQERERLAAGVGVDGDASVARRSER